MLLKKWIAYRGNPWNDQVSYYEKRLVSYVDVSLAIQLYSVSSPSTGVSVE